MNSLKLKNISKEFSTKSRNIQVLKNINLEIPAGSFVSILGPSGCGKTTLLNIIAGFLQPSSGSVSIDNKPITKPGMDRVMIFQDNAVFPWLTVTQNIEFALENKYASRDVIEEKTKQFLNIVQLTKFADYYPKQLSGGMKKRVDIARGFAINPPILLADEPFASLDTNTKLQLQIELAKLWLEQKNTILFVTHDIEEAIFLSDRIYLLTNRPSAILKTIHVPFKQPRNPNIIPSNKFQSLRKNIMNFYARN